MRGHGGANVAQGAPGQLLDGGDLRKCALRVPPLAQPACEPGLDGDRRKRVAEQVVQVTCDARALVLGGQPSHFGTGGGERDVLLDDAEEAEHRQSDQKDAQPEGPIGLPAPAGHEERQQQAGQAVHDHDRQRPVDLRGNRQHRQIHEQDQCIAVRDEAHGYRQRETYCVERPEGSVLFAPTELQRRQVNGGEQRDQDVSNDRFGAVCVPADAVDRLAEIDQPEAGEQPAPEPGTAPRSRGELQPFV